jgi:ABC-type glycerol-3-phosphate transport system substrate-binding protein
MKTRSLLAALTLAGLLAACGGDAPTGAKAPDHASFDTDTSTTNGRGNGSLGPGH